MPLNIDTTLRQISRSTEEGSARDLATRLGIAYATLDNYPFNLDVLSLLPIEKVRELGIAVYLRTAKRVRIAILHPERNDLIQEVVRLGQEWQKEVELTVVSESSFHFLLTSYQKLLNERAEAEKQQLLQTNHSKEENYFQSVQSLTDLQNEISKTSTTTLVDVILAAAINQGASDVHIEPGGEHIVIRFRIDGVLQRVLEIPSTLHHQLISRIKVLSNLKLDVQTSSQDGRFSLGDKGIKADIRVSTIPTGYGEGVVMRILRQDMQILSLAELGFSTYNQNLITQVSRKPYGLIVVTGPTGSGKSTTLYALLQLLNTPDKKIITLEDPIEYRLDGLQQSQIDNEKGFTFAEGLRGALRQDPDVVMVGEIRDPETATIALNASLTGHLVLSTLHTNNAVTAHTRFLEMGIQPFLLTGSIQAIIAQRLVRRLVPGSTAENPQYKGRLVIGEVLCPNSEFETAVNQKRDQSTLEEIALRNGMIPILQDGLEKVKEGLTTESEIYRVTAG